MGNNPNHHRQDQFHYLERAAGIVDAAIAEGRALKPGEESEVRLLRLQAEQYGVWAEEAEARHKQP